MPRRRRWTVVVASVAVLVVAALAVVGVRWLTADDAAGLMTNTTLDPDDPAYRWVDQGEVVRSAAGEDNFNAIDPAVITDQDGTPWMAFGSFWGGLQLVELAWPAGTPVPGAEPVTVASRIGAPNAIEAPTLVQRDGWFYLFF